MKKKALEMVLQGLEEPPGNPRWEQYLTPAPLAAEILFLALAQGDIEGRTVVDLGCGGGTLALGAKLLGASRAEGFDIDPRAVEVAASNARRLDVSVSFQVLPVEEVRGRWDTCVMNPPFGSQKRHADRPFLKRALEVAEIAYTLHHGETEAFVRKEGERLGGEVTLCQRYKFPIPHQFPFHRRKTEDVEVLLFRFKAVRGHG